MGGRGTCLLSLRPQPLPSVDRSDSAFLKEEEEKRGGVGRASFRQIPIPETMPPTQLRSPFHNWAGETEKPGEGHKQDGRGPRPDLVPTEDDRKDHLPAMQTHRSDAAMETPRSRDRPSTPTLPRGTGEDTCSHMDTHAGSDTRVWSSLGIRGQTPRSHRQAGTKLHI